MPWLQIAGDAEQIAEGVERFGGRSATAGLGRPGNTFFQRIDALPEGVQPKVIDVLDEYLESVDVSKAWNNYGLAQVEEVRNKFLSQMANKYGLSTFQRNRQSDDVASALREAQGPPPAWWGNGSDVLGADGESLLITAGVGVGKTTLAGLLARGFVFGGEVLGQPVRTLAPGQKILYLALDRPDQIARSLARQFTAEQLDALQGRLVIWRGPLPADAAEEPAVLKDVANYYGHDVAVVIVDSLKDAARGLSEDRVGAAYDTARKRLLESGRQLIELHHLTKGGDGYGSVWLSAGAGSVIRLTGSASSKLGTLTHMKQPARVVGPLKFAHDRVRGEISLHAKDVTAAVTEGRAKDLAKWVAGHGADGVTAAEAALFLGYESEGPSGRQRARRALDEHTEEGGLYCIAGTRGGKPSRWVSADEAE